MTHEQWMAALAPVITALILGLAGIVTVVLSGISGRLRAYLEVRGQAQASQILTDASGRLQAAMQNSAGQIALRVQAGALDVTDLAAVRAEAAAQAAEVAAKVPQAIAIVQPLAGAITEGILGKLGTLAATAALPAQAQAAS